MGNQRMGWVGAAAGLLIGLSGCGDHNNFFGSLADDTSIEAKIEEAQIALDQGDCQTAINGFTSAYNHDPSSAANRVNLAAAYTCRAGFNVPALIRIAADFAGSNQSADQYDLLKAIVNSTVDLVSDTWDADTGTAISLLSDLNLPVIGGCSPAPFDYNPDAAFNKGIVATVRAVMAITTLRNLATGAILTGNITPSIATIVGGSLRDADGGIKCADSLAGGVKNVIVKSDVAEAIADLNVGINNLDGDMTNDVTKDELQQFLGDQGFSLE